MLKTKESKRIYSIYFLLIFFILCPVIEIQGSRILLQEIFLYIYLVSYYIKSQRKLCDNYVFTFLKINFWLSLSSIVISVLVSGQSFNNYDIYLLRNILQFFAAALLFENIIDKLKVVNAPQKAERYFFNIFCLLSIPSLITFLQYFDVGGCKEFIKSLYIPIYGFLTFDDLNSIRVTSVFIDSFTCSVYTIVLTGAIFYFYLVNNRFRRFNVKFLFLIVLNYGSQFFVARSGVVFIPVLLLAISLFSIRDKPKRKKVFLLFVIMFPVVLLFINVYESMAGKENLQWISESLNLFNSNRNTEDFSSYKVMHEMNQDFYEFLKKDLKILFVPYHDYELANNMGAFTDNFYLKEIFRYGIYGIVSYLIATFFLLKKAIQNRHHIIIAVVVILSILNYKGGNTFLMQRNIYLYSFIFIQFMIHERKRFTD